MVRKLIGPRGTRSDIAQETVDVFIFKRWQARKIHHWLIPSGALKNGRTADLLLGKDLAPLLG